MAEADSRPSTPSWLNEVFVQNTLRAGDADPTLTVLSSEVRWANAVGDGYGSDMYRVVATLQDGKQRSLIVKCHLQGGMRETVMKKWQAFEKEMHMFTHTLPAMHSLLEKAQGCKYKPLSCRCLHVGDTPMPYLVLEDLKEAGFAAPKKCQGLDLRHCQIVVNTLARFHASSLALYEDDRSSLEYYAEGLYRPSLRDDISGIIESSFMSLQAEVAKWPGYEKYADKLKTLKAMCFDRLIDVCGRKEGQLNCLVHEDPWTANMLFKYINGDVVDFRLVDFQTTHYSSPALDLQYFFHTSVTEDVYKNHLDKLIQEYHQTFIQTLNDLGISKNHITLNELKEEIDSHMYFALFAAAAVLPVVLSGPQDSYNVEESLKNKEMRTGGNNIYSAENYVRAIKIFLPIFESKGIL